MSAHKRAKIHGFEIKALGQNTGLVESDNTKTVVQGLDCKIENERDAERLCVYETTAYEVVSTDAQLEAGSVARGIVFRYAGNHKLLR